MNRPISIACSVVFATWLAGCGATHLDPIGLGRSPTDASTGGGSSAHADAGARDTGVDGAASGGAGGSDSGSGKTDAGARSADAGDAALHVLDAGLLDAADAVTHPPLVATRVVTGERHTCVLLSDGTVRCWGGNTYGQLGYGNTQNIGDDELPSAAGPVSVTTTPGVTVTELAAGWQHTCALLSDGTVKCWGWNDQGQLGYGNTENIGDDELPSSVGPVSITTTPGVTVTAITGGRHTCALLSDGTVRCWGGGPLGYGNTTTIGDDELPSSAGPVSITTNAGVTATAIANGFYHTCAILSDRSLHCWGQNGYGQLGLGTVDSLGDDELPSTVGPVSVTTLPGVTVSSVTGGFFRTCALLSNGSVECWGAGSNGAGSIGYGNSQIIGDDELPSSVGAISVTTKAGITTTAIGGGVHHVCALLSDRSVQCWGENKHGQLGYGTTDTIGDDELPSSMGPVSVTTAPGLHVTALASGCSSYHSCAILSDGSVKCWGFNSDGELGIGVTGDLGDDELPSSIDGRVGF